jgi:hypothetical protein
MRTRVLSLAVICALGFSACSRRDEDAAERKVRKAAHEIAIESKKVVKEAEREVGHATREVHEGRKEAEHKDEAKDRK